jgi:hypothetical protein
MADTTPAPTYVVEAGDVARDRDAVLAIWHGNLGQDARMRAKFDWFYACCPFGPPLLCLLRHTPDDTRIGVATAGPRRMLWHGTEISAGLLVDLAVTAEHRSLGPAMMLQTALAETGCRRFDLLYGFPNPKAAAVFKRVGYDKLGDIVRHARVLRHAQYIARRMPRLLASLAGVFVDTAVRIRDAWRSRSDPRIDFEWSHTADVRFDALWASSPHGDGLIGVRDAAFARWRFDASPLSSTRYLLISDESTGSLLAWFACQIDENVLHVRDFWADDAAAGIGRAHVDVLLRAARAAGYAAVSVEYSGADAKLEGWRGAGFTERSRRPVFGKWADGRSTEGIDLHLTSADEDE